MRAAWHEDGSITSVVAHRKPWSRTSADAAGLAILSGYPVYIQNIFRAMQTHGPIVADNGSDMYVSGTIDPRWNNDELNPAFRSLAAW